MIIYILKKIFTFIFILFLLSQLSFCIVFFSSDSYFSDLSFFHAYFNYFKQLFLAELPLSADPKQTFIMTIKQVLPSTIELCLFALLFSLILGIILGIIAGLKPNRWQNKCIQACCLIIGSCPLVWLAVLIIFIFSGNAYFLPEQGSLVEQINPVTGFPIIDILLTSDLDKSQEMLKEIQYLALPVIILSIHPCIITIQLVSKRIENVAKQNYIKTVTIREQSQWKILFRHMLPNVFPPIIPKLTYNMTIVLFSAMLVEIIFSRQGIGNWVMQAFSEHNSIVIAVAVILCGALLCSLNFISELIIIIIHPLRHKELYDE